MMHPIASQAVARERQKDLLKAVEGQRRARVAFHAQEGMQQKEALLDQCGQPRRMNSLLKDHLS